MRPEGISLSGEQAAILRSKSMAQQIAPWLYYWVQE